MPETPTSNANPTPDTANIDRIVDARIRLYLFNMKFLGAGGAILLALLVYFHKDIINGIVWYGGSQLQNSIQDQNKKYLEQYQRESERHLDTLRVTQRELEIAQTQLKTSNEVVLKEQDRFLNKVSEFRDQYFALVSKAEALRKEAEDAQKKVSELIKALDETGEVTRTRISAAQQSAIQEAEKRIAALAEKFNALQSTVVADLKDRGVNKVIATTITDVSAKIERPTVYFQFAGFSREEAQTISKAIRDRGHWNIPGEERTVKAVDTNEIRYNPADKLAVQLLLSEANQALKTLNINITLVAKENRSVRAGFVEIWIYKA